jgi:glycosyltransferase involved in cell wall biosynthesis
VLSSRLVGAGGAERLTFEEVTHLERAGYSVRLITFEHRPEARFGGAYDAPVEVLPAGHGPTGDLRALWRLTRWLLRVRPRLVIASSVFDCTYLWLPARLARVPYITHIHGTFFWYDDDRKFAWIHRAALRKVLARSPFHREFVAGGPRRSGVMATPKRELPALIFLLGARAARARLVMSRRTAWEVGEMYGVPAIVLKGAFPARIFDHVPGPDPFEDLHARGPVMLNVNRLEPRKRVDLTIRAFALALPRLGDATLVIGGTGRIEQALRRLAHDLGIADRVMFAGFIPEAQLLDRLWHCDVFIHMNWAEYAIAPLEALALGTKVVWSTEMEMDPEIGATGLVFPADPTPEATADALADALRAPADRSRRRLLEPYTWERYFGGIAAVVDQVIRGEPPRGTTAPGARPTPRA